MLIKLVQLSKFSRLDSLPMQTDILCLFHLVRESSNQPAVFPSNFSSLEFTRLILSFTIAWKYCLVSFCKSLPLSRTLILSFFFVTPKTLAISGCIQLLAACISWEWFCIIYNNARLNLCHARKVRMHNWCILSTLLRRANSRRIFHGLAIKIYIFDVCTQNTGPTLLTVFLTVVILYEYADGLYIRVCIVTSLR